MIDQVKRQIIHLYEEDLKKIDASGRLSALYHAIPAQLSKDVKQFRISAAPGKRKTSGDDHLVYDFIFGRIKLKS